MKKKRWLIISLLATGFVLSIVVGVIIGGPWPAMLALAYMACVFSAAVVYAAIKFSEPGVPPAHASSRSNETVESLLSELESKKNIIKDLSQKNKHLIQERDAYRRQRDEAHIREELYKKQIRELRGRAEYWRAKYKAIVNVERDPTDGEIVITPNPDAEC